MPKSKKSALRGPKLNKRLAPIIHNRTQTHWAFEDYQGRAFLATIDKVGRQHQAEYTAEDAHFVSTSSASPATAKKTLERRMEATCETLMFALGWERK